ncbi:hypothetical protein H4582DRAFT_1199066 [Lactarius indigo]|nr:hypothetical protein H4582DRAFT_1199066 [Lactarius indigo]
MYDRSTAKSRTERRRATPRSLGRRPLREPLTIHTGVALFLETRRVEEGLVCADKVKNPAAYNTCYFVFDAEFALSHGRSGPIGARVWCTCSANHDFSLPWRTGSRRKAARNGKRVPSVGCAGTDGGRLPVGRQALALSLSRYCLLQEARTGALSLALLAFTGFRRTWKEGPHRAVSMDALLAAQGCTVAGAGKREKERISCGLLRVLSHRELLHMQFFATIPVCFTALPCPRLTTASDGRTSPSPSSFSRNAPFIHLFFYGREGPSVSEQATNAVMSDRQFVRGVFNTDTSADADATTTAAVVVVVVVTRVFVPPSTSARAHNTGLLASSTIAAVLQYAVVAVCEYAV